MKEKKYEIACNNLYMVIDIAIQSIKKYPPKRWDIKTLNHILDVYNGFREIRMNAEPKFQTLSSLKYDYENVFTYFQESAGEDVEEFWKRIKESDLPFKRENKLGKILKRKKINNDIEFDFVTDVILPYLQDGLINEEESILLKQYIGDFEHKRKK